MVVLVPRQLARSGMTGNVPYYGGRLSPAQAYAASHPPPPPGTYPPPPPPAAVPASSAEETRAALAQLHESGLLTDEEYTHLLTRLDQ